MQKDKAYSIVLLVVLSIIWGSSFILMKTGLTAYSWQQVAAMRISIAGLIFIPYVLFKIKAIKKLKYILLFAFLEVGFPPFCFTFAQQYVDSSTAGILNSLVPLFTLLTGLFLFSVKTDFLKILGVSIGLFGALLIVAFKQGSATFMDFSNAYGLLIVLATLMYGIAGNVLKEKLSDVSSMLITATSFTCLGIPAAIFLFSTGVTDIPLSNAHNLKAFLSITTLSIFGSALAIVIFNVLIKKSTALFASFVTYLVPFMALFWGALDGENISYIHFLSLILILLGISIANKKIKNHS